MRIRIALFLFCIAILGRLFAQPASQDPLMSLMLAQPKIDVESPVVPSAVFDPPEVRPGERATYRVSFNALETSIELPQRIPAFEKLSLRPGAHAQLLAIAGASLQPRTTFNYHFRPVEPGQYTIPGYTVRVYGKPVSVPPAQLEVIGNSQGSILPAQQLFLEIPSTNVYVGQALRVRVFAPPGMAGSLQALAQVQINGTGFITDQTTVRQRVAPLPRTRAGAIGQALIYEMTLTPIAAGRLSAFAQGYAVGPRSLGGMAVVGPGIAPGPGQYTLLDSDPVEFQVKPLPREGELAGFTGAVGSFLAEAPQLTTNVLQVGEPVKLTVRIRGEGNLVRLVPPPAPRVPDWQIFPGPRDGTHPQIIQAQGFTTFSYTLIPLNPQAQATPAIPFRCFDPEEGRYVDRDIPAIPVMILPGSAVPDLPVLAEAEAAAKQTTEQEPVLSDLAASPGLAAPSLVPLQKQAWFPLVQLAPAAMFLSVWGWDRRRRFLEAHPEVVLRRRALRALSRERRCLRKAARRGDAEAFASAAVKAMRVACSPHYPAEPRALVGADVMELLSETERQGSRGRTVRRFFAAHDASHFAAINAVGDGLLGLQSELEELLQALEQRL